MRVALLAEQVMLGMQSMGVMACMKHFPGHGDTAVDSHVDLPTVQTLELFPFKHLSDAGVAAAMSAHLYVPALSEDIATFSKHIVTDVLQKEIGFKGLVLTDALNMQAVAKRYSAGQCAVRALLAGHDLLLYGDHIAPNIDQILRIDVPAAFNAIKEAVESGAISEELIDAKVEKILHVKQTLRQMEQVEDVVAKIHSPEAYDLKRRLYEEAMTLVKNEGVLPIAERCALIVWGEVPYFVEAFDTQVLSLDDPELLSKLEEHPKAVLAISETRGHSAMQALSTCGVPVALVLFGSPYMLSRLPSYDSVLVAYEDEREAQEAAAKVVLGEISAHGKLPVTVFKEGSITGY